MIIDCISDLHGYYPKLDGGDLLIVAGDLTARDSENEVALFDYWLSSQKYSAKIVIAGNHDNVLKEKRLKLQFGTYFEDSGCSFNGFKMWGTPWSLWFPGINPRCTAFTGSEEDLAEKYALIPDDTDILISHSPMYGILDGVADFKTGKTRFTGSQSLRAAVDRVKPRLHVFGHIHEFGGTKGMYKHSGPNTWCVNASYVNERYEPVNKPIRIEL